MKTLLRLEELAQLLLCVAALMLKDAAWWWYLVLFIGPDVGMIGYLANARVGAFTYNLTHHKGIALLLLLAALVAEMGQMLTKVDTVLLLLALAMYGHSSMDRMLGYGMKFGDHFKHTHLGWIGRKTTR